MVDKYKVYYAKTEPKSRDTGIDHTGFTFLVDGGKYLGFFPPGTSTDRMFEIIRPHVGALAQRQLACAP